MPLKKMSDATTVFEKVSKHFWKSQNETFCAGIPNTVTDRRLKFSKSGSVLIVFLG